MADFLEPTGMVWLLLSVWLVVALRRRQWRAMILPGAAWVLLTLTSATGLPHWLLASLEAQWPPVDLTALPECDAVIVLGGGMEPSRSEPAGIHFMGGTDRLFTGLMLAKKGKGKLLVVGGGSAKTISGIESEADAVKLWVEEWQVSPVPVQSLGNCLDTHDEAVKVSALAVKHGWKRVALVTSAYHMTRSRAVFETAGTVVVPVPCNYLSVALRGHSVKWLEVPNATNLGHFEAWMHEMVGWWAYRLCGWV
jgi:uncharacterized SAM-binding protein YcdF (DUF218 family)